MRDPQRRQPRRQRAGVDAVDEELVRAHASRGGRKAEEGSRGERLACAGLTDDRDAFAGLDREVEAVDRRRVAERHRQPAHAQPAHRVRPSDRARTTRPSTVAAMTVRVIAAPGNTEIHQARRSRSCLREHQPPLRRRLGRTQAEEAESRRREDARADADGRQHAQRTDHTGHDVPGERERSGHSQDPRGFDVLREAQRTRLGAARRM